MSKYICVSLSSFVLHGIYTDGDKDEWDLVGL